MSGSVDNQIPRALTSFFGHLKSFSRQSLRSQLALEPIQKASVLLLLSLPLIAVKNPYSLYQQ